MCLETRYKISKEINTLLFNELVSYLNISNTKRKPDYKAGNKKKTNKSATKMEANHGINKTDSINIFLAMTLALYK